MRPRGRSRKSSGNGALRLFGAWFLRMKLEGIRRKSRHMSKKTLEQEVSFGPNTFNATILISI